MKAKTISVTSSFDQEKLYADLYLPAGQPRALIAVFHGMAEHRFRYNYFAQKLLNDGYAILLCDHRGHGESGSVKGYFAQNDGWQQNVWDLQALIAEAKKEISEVPLFIFGHSMGSLFARSYLKRYEAEVEAVILCGTPAENKLAGIGNTLAQVTAFFAGEHYRSKLLDKLSFGSYNKVVRNPRTDYDWLSRNPDNVDEYIADDNCGFIFTARGFADVTSGLQDVYDAEGWSVRKSELPIAFFSGADDPCSCVAAGFSKAVEKLHSLGYNNISTKLYPGLRHEILNEEERDEVIEDMTRYFDKVLTDIDKKKS